MILEAEPLDGCVVRVRFEDEPRPRWTSLTCSRTAVCSNRFVTLGWA